MIFLEVLPELSFAASSKYQKTAIKALGTRMNTSLKTNWLAWTSHHFIVWLEDKIYNHTTPYIIIGMNLSRWRGNTKLTYM